MQVAMGETKIQRAYIYSRACFVAQMNRRSALIACFFAFFLVTCTCGDGISLDERLENQLDEDGDGKVSDAEITNFKAKKWHPRCLRTTTFFDKVCLGAEKRVSVANCSQRLKDALCTDLLCTDLNEDGFIVIAEFRSNTKKISSILAVKNSAVQKSSSLVADVADVAAAEANAAAEAKADAEAKNTTEVKADADTKAAAEANNTAKVKADAETKNTTEVKADADTKAAATRNAAASSSDTFCEWRSISADNTRISDSWIVPLVNDPRSLLIWLRFFDKSSFLDRIDDDVEKSSIIEFAFTCAFVPSYPLFRMVQKQTAFSFSSLFGCDSFQSHVGFFLFLRFLCEGWSFITLILWCRGTYQTPGFGTIWFMSIAKHILGTTAVAAVMYYCMWHVMPSFIMSSVSYIFIYIIWPLGSLLLVHGLIMDGLKPATFAAIKAAPPRPKAHCRSPAMPLSNRSLDAGSHAGLQRGQPGRRGSGARAMSPTLLR
jgi:hypothetical protein